MKILQLSALFPPHVMGGAEGTAFYVGKGLHDRGHSIDVVSLVPPQTPASIEQIEGMTVHRIPLQNHYWPYQTKQFPQEQASSLKKILWHWKDINNQAMAKGVADLAKRTRPDLVLSHNTQGFSVAVWKSLSELGLPIIQVMHDLALICPRVTVYRNGHPCQFGDKRCTSCRVMSAPKRPQQKYVSAVIGVSQAVLDVYHQHGWWTNIPSQAIHNALPTTTTIAPVKALLQANEVLTLGYLGRVNPEKGIETLLTAMSGVPTQRCRLLVAGHADPQYLSDLKQRYPLPNVQYLGFVTRDDLFAQVDALVFPSWGFEALGNGVFEAMACGIPALASRNGGIAEIFEEGISGYGFNPGDSNALASLIQGLLTAPKERLQSLRDGALARAQHFTLPRQITEYETFIHKVLANHSHNVA